MARLEALRNNLGPEAYNELAVPSTCEDHPRRSSSPY